MKKGRQAGLLKRLDADAGDGCGCTKPASMSSGQAVSKLEHTESVDKRAGRVLTESQMVEATEVVADEVAGCARESARERRKRQKRATEGAKVVKGRGGVCRMGRGSSRFSGGLAAVVISTLPVPMIASP